jgi:ubiquitin-like modifier-activating enzyme ATG7
LNSFTAIFFANLKKFHFNYWFAFPTLNSALGWKMSAPSKLGSRETQALVSVYQSWSYKTNPRQTGFFLLKRCPENAPKKGGSSTSSEATGEDPQEWVVDSIDAYDRGFFNNVAKEDRFFAFVDPSTYPSYPGIMLRNYLHLISELWKETDINVLCYRETHESRDVPHSIVLKVHRDASENEVLPPPKIIGWEKDRHDRNAPRFMDLSAIMDPNRLADQAVDLNLKLIKWRIAPSIDLDVIKNTSCLLLGSGTLGSYVSRILMAWGVRKITFVDNATVSYSNPVRQPLFTHHDASHAGTQKAEAAAKALKEVFPGMDAKGEVMSVPMLGHPPLDIESAKNDLTKLEKLIEEHDAVFLLMDTRESRWLPTVIGKAKNKIVLNAALGFESYVIMRHGMEKEKPEDLELGCYFCNDVVAPANVSCLSLSVSILTQIVHERRHA